MKAKYTYEYVDDVLVIVDKLGPRSVTNDIENILRTIHLNDAIDLTGKKIVYRDSEFIWDGVSANNILGYATPAYRISFIPLRQTTVQDAIVQINKYYANEKID